MLESSREDNSAAGEPAQNLSQHWWGPRWCHLPRKREALLCPPTKTDSAAAATSLQAEQVGSKPSLLGMGLATAVFRKGPQCRKDWEPALIPGFYNDRICNRWDYRRATRAWSSVWGSKWARKVSVNGRHLPHRLTTHCGFQLTD